MNSLPPPRLSGLAWRTMSKGGYAVLDKPLEQLEADLASDYDLTGSDARGAVWETAIGDGSCGLHEVVLCYEAEAAKLKPGVRRAGLQPNSGFRSDLPRNSTAGSRH